MEIWKGTRAQTFGDKQDVFLKWKGAILTILLVDEEIIPGGNQISFFHVLALIHILLLMNLVA